MDNSTMQRLELNAKEQKGLAEILQKPLKFEPEKVIISRLPSEVVMTVSFYGPKKDGVQRLMQWWLSPDGKGAKTALSE